MEKNRKILFIAIIIIVAITGCNDRYSMSPNSFLKEQRKTFSDDYSKHNLLSHFPEKLINDSLSFFSYPASCPPSFECSCQAGEEYMITKIHDYKENVKKLLEDSLLYVSDYSIDSNIIIDDSELKHSFFPVDKCNKFYKNRYPVPYFESINFGLGGEKIKKVIVDGETHKNYTYSIPADLKVYVISAEPGNFWKVDCNEKRPESLKEWKNGYSRGIAISEKEGLVVYWVMIW